MRTIGSDTSVFLRLCAAGPAAFLTLCALLFAGAFAPGAASADDGVEPCEERPGWLYAGPGRDRLDGGPGRNRCWPGKGRKNRGQTQIKSCRPKR